MTDFPPNEPPPPSAPATFGITVRDWGDEAAARQLGECVGSFVREFSRYIDLANLDGLTMGGDYPRALAELDRGYASTIVLTPSNDVAIGVAMTPSVIRDGQLKSHVVLNAGLAAALSDSEHELFPLALHTLAHECAHVEITAAFERCFPNVLLRSKRADLQEQCRWDVILACWDEYAATRISAGFGEDPTDGYEETFIQALKTTRENANNAIRAYRLHGGHSQIVCEVYTEYGRLMKYAAYLLGDLDAREAAIEDRPLSATALEGHAFRSVLQRLREALRQLYEGFGAWTNEKPFEVIGDIVDDLAGGGGVYVTKAGPGLVNIKVPFRPETMPF
jgi:hypothetical protein